MRHALIAAFVLACATANAQELERPPVKPVEVMAPMGGNGHAETWDGRVFVVTRNIYAANYEVGWAVLAFRPGNVTRDARGAPVLDGGAFSQESILELDSARGTGMSGHNALALAPAPGFSENPFKSNADGSANPDGAFETYECVVFTQWYDGPGGTHLGQRRARIVVKNPRTKDAAIEKAEMLSAFVPLATRTGGKLLGFEPSVTFDGRLMVWNDGERGVLVYSWNPTPCAVSGWSPRRQITEMYHVDRNVDVQGIPFHERFPIAKEQLKGADGQLFAKGEYLGASYPWISLDGTEVFYTATKVADGARRAGLSCVGRWTGWATRHLDGPINPDRTATGRLFFSSPGAKPSFWSPWREVPEVPIPYTPGAPIYPLFGSNTSNYVEASFEDHEDQDYVLALHVNELVTKGEDSHYDLLHTPDTSGNFNTGTLVGARFPQEVTGIDRNDGFVGQSIRFGPSDSVRVKRSASLDAVKKALTVSLAVKPFAAGARTLAQRSGAWTLALEGDGRVRATVRVGGADRSATSASPVPLNEWTPVAFTFDGARGELRVLVAGRLESAVSFPAGELSSTTSDLLIGPAGSGGARDPVVALDEVMVSRVVRTPAELARAAFVDVRAQPFGAKVPLPRGLAERDLRIPVASPVTAEAVELGKMLFFDARLSEDRSTSCATCHDPARSFQDGFPVAHGRNGKLLPRNTPAIVNRALSTIQFLDGRAGSLEEQALGPIENPDEMGSSAANVAARLALIPEYDAAFKKAFGGASPSPDGIARALAAFQRTLLSGDSRADRFEAGDRTALDESEKRGRRLFAGKARCTACHAGSNFTDEALHATAATADADVGGEAVSGRRRERRAFKTPTLRDVARTAPYFHDGSAATLEEVVDLYDRGGRSTNDRDSEVRPLGLTVQEKADLVAYLRALDGGMVAIAPPTLPSDPKLPRRRAVRHP